MLSAIASWLPSWRAPIRGALLVGMGLAATACAHSGVQPSTGTAPSSVSGALAPPAFTPTFGTMWTFDAPPTAYWQSRYGFAPDQQWLDHVRLSAVRLPGCSGSFVSAEGLVMTNHHCGRACTAAVSPADTDYVEHGFAATSMADEKKCPNFAIQQLQSIEDITTRVLQAAQDAHGNSSPVRLDSATHAIAHECETSTGLTCQVVELYHGGVYALYRYRRFTDVRLVMAPEAGIAFFGGDPDNFTYPRYDFDATFLRVYVDDKPFAPSDYLHWASHGVSEGDPVFVVGNPGSTDRLLPIAQVAYMRDVLYPVVIRALQRRLDVLRADSVRRPDAARASENERFGVANSLKAFTGYERGLKDSTLMNDKRAFESDVRRRLAANPDLEHRYADAWDSIAVAARELSTVEMRRRYYIGFLGLRLLPLAETLLTYEEQTAKPEAARQPVWRIAHVVDSVKTLLTTDRPFDQVSEEELLTAHLRDALHDLGPNDPFVRAALGGQSPDVAAKHLVEGTRVGTAAGRQTLMDGGTEGLAGSADPMIVLARTIEPELTDLTERAHRASAIVAANVARVGRAEYAVYGHLLPPDATFTLRITDGVVKGYRYNGTEAPYKTTFYGLFDRVASFDSTPPFTLPPRFAAHRSQIDLSTPFDFVSTNDIIGGNSGSPVINRNGEVVGLIFDGNIESLPNDFVYTDETARAVSLDARAIPMVLRTVYDDPQLADELTGQARTQ